ncbi:MAG TPA: aspartate-alanine antiporter [Steroidobacteraceae bacterium]|nr:aspartate-alanine antiporter [Steroidobacteraceae bacterium]
MTAVQGILQAHPEIAFFLVLGLGYLLGKIALGSFKLGAVTGTLLAGVIVGQLEITLSNDVKQCFFLLFLFAIGFRTGPQFFRGLRSDGLQHAALAAIVAVTGLLVGWFVAALFGYDAGTAAGLIAGSLTESATIGTAMDAISKLDLADAEKAALNNAIPVAFAVTYLVGVIGAAWVLSQLAPKLLRIDLAEECRKYEEQTLGSTSALQAARREHELRAYMISRDSPWAGRTVADFEAAGGTRVFIERLRSRGEVTDPDPRYVLRAGDTIAVAGARTTLVEVLESADTGLAETDDRDLLGMAGEMLDVVVTNHDVDGISLADLGRLPDTRGAFLRRITRGGQSLSAMPNTVVHRGDVLTIVGLGHSVARTAKFLGVADRATDVTDMFVVATGIVAGALIGLPAIHVAGIEIGLSLPVGVLLGGLVAGYVRAIRPRWFGRIPTPTLWIFESIGLTGFVAVVGLNAGPDFVRGVQESGLTLVLAGAITVSVSLLVGVLVGRWLFRMHPGVLLGVCAGGCTATPALAAVQEAARSSVPSIGYGVAYAVGNVFLAIWGTVIVLLMA